VGELFFAIAAAPVRIVFNRAGIREQDEEDFEEKLFRLQLRLSGGG
jgi:hypothetical protein